MQHSSTDRQETNDFISFCIKIALTYLHHIHKRLKRKLNIYSFNNEDIAIESITELFLSADDKTETPLIRAFRNWKPKITCNEEALYFLNVIIGQSVEQHLTRVMGEHDPFFAKYLQVINHRVQTDGYTKHCALGTTYIIKDEENSANLNYIPASEFAKLPDELFLNTKYFLNDIITYLRHRTDYKCAIPLNDLAYRMKQSNLRHINTTKNSFHPSATIVVKEYVDEAIKTVLMKIDNYYLKHDKLSIIQAENIKKAFADIQIDLQNNSPLDTAYTYLHKQIPDLSKKKYKQDYQHIFEYLLRMLKQTIRQLIRIDTST